MTGPQVGETVEIYCEECGFRRECEYRHSSELMFQHSLKTGHSETHRETAENKEETDER